MPAVRASCAAAVYTLIGPEVLSAPCMAAVASAYDVSSAMVLPASTCLKYSCRYSMEHSCWKRSVPTMAGMIDGW